MDKDLNNLGLPDLSSLVQQANLENILSITNEEQQEISDWLKGKTRETPEVVRTLTNNIQEKLNYSLCAVITANMRRSITLLNYIEKVERTIYSEENANQPYSDNLKTDYLNANKTLVQALEFTRKFMIQNRDCLTPDDTKVDEVKTLLSQLPIDRLNKIAEAIAEGKI